MLSSIKGEAVARPAKTSRSSRPRLAELSPLWARPESKRPRGYFARDGQLYKSGNGLAIPAMERLATSRADPLLPSEAA